MRLRDCDRRYTSRLLAHLGCLRCYQLSLDRTIYTTTMSIIMLCWLLLVVDGSCYLAGFVFARTFNSLHRQHHLHRLRCHPALTAAAPPPHALLVRRDREAQP